MKWLVPAVFLAVLACGPSRSVTPGEAGTDGGPCQTPTPSGAIWIAPHSPDGPPPVPAQTCLDGYAALVINVTMPTRLMAGVDFHTLYADVAALGLDGDTSVAVTEHQQPVRFVTAFALSRDAGMPPVDVAIAGKEDDLVMFSRLTPTLLEPGQVKSLTVDFSEQ